MKKYIRVNNKYNQEGIYLIDEKDCYLDVDCETNEKFKVYVIPDRDFCVTEDEVDMISEHLEPLLDSYIFVKNEKENGKTLWFQNRYSVDYHDNWTEYGCILTSKGLVYVAKMNKNNKFELI